MKPTKFDFTAHFVNGFSRIKQDFKWGFIDIRGRVVVEPIFDIVYDFEDNGLAVVGQDGKYGLINANGEIVLKPQFDEPWIFCANGLAGVEKNGKFGVVNSDGKILLEPWCNSKPLCDSWLDIFSQNGLAQITQDSKIGFINLKEEMVIKPEFDALYYGFNGGLALVGKGNDLFYINEKGETVAYTDTICDERVVKNYKNKVIYPKNFKSKCNDG
jgi:hypothetical protein